MRRKKLFGARSLLTLFLCISAFSLSAQTITVRGIVTDDGHEPVIGATVVVKEDPSKGTITDLDGNYVLNDVPSDGIIRGPAIEPSLVICPIIKTQMFSFLASRISSKVISRTCDTEPGAEAIFSL